MRNGELHITKRVKVLRPSEDTAEITRLLEDPSLGKKKSNSKVTNKTK